MAREIIFSAPQSGAAPCLELELEFEFELIIELDLIHTQMSSVNTPLSQIK